MTWVIWLFDGLDIYLFFCTVTVCGTCYCWFASCLISVRLCDLTWVLFFIAAFLKYGPWSLELALVRGLTSVDWLTTSFPTIFLGFMAELDYRRLFSIGSYLLLLTSVSVMLAAEFVTGRLKLPICYVYVLISAFPLRCALLLSAGWGSVGVLFCSNCMFRNI